MLGSSTNITLHSADGDEFNPTWPARLKRLFSFLTGFATRTDNGVPFATTGIHGLSQGDLEACSRLALGWHLVP